MGQEEREASGDCNEIERPGAVEPRGIGLFPARSGLGCCASLWPSDLHGRLTRSRNLIASNAARQGGVVALEFPQTVQPLWRFTVHVVLGALAFLVVFLVAVGLGHLVDWGASHGAEAWVVYYGRMAEELLYALDLFGLALFIVKEFIKLGKHMLLKDWEY